MTVDKLREILSYYPADAEVSVIDDYGYEDKLDRMVIKTYTYEGLIRKLLYMYVTKQPGRKPGYTHGAF